MAKTRTIKKQFGSELLPVSVYRITDIFKNINTKDYKFLKYIPDRFITAEQSGAKRHAIEEDEKKSNTPTQKNQDRTTDTDYLSAVERGDMETAQRMVDEAAETSDISFYYILL